MISKYLLLGIIFLFFLILILYDIYKEGFSNPTVINTPLRADKTCSDPKMMNRIDRFHYVTNYDPIHGCGGNGEAYPTYRQYNYFGNSNICLPNCPDMYKLDPNDHTYCVATNDLCYLTPDLSSNILNNWSKVCGPLYKFNDNINSTIGSISSVVSTINVQYKLLTPVMNGPNNFLTLLSNGSPDDTLNRFSTNFYPGIVSNYNDIYSYQAIINSNYIELNNKKNNFDIMYNSFNCANYM